MFCPNCGTKNDDKVEKCAQCGFDQKAKKDTKFKGTVMMQGSPGAAPGTPGSGVSSASRKASNPALKGTMVGVAPPGLEAIRQQALQAAASKAPAPATSSNKLKGTMVGLAPPGMEELRRQHTAQTAASQAKSEAAPAAPATQSAASKLKGTMIGLAPPDMSKEIEAAKLKMAAQKAAVAPATGAAARPSSASQANIASQASAAPAHSSAVTNSSAVPNTSAVPSKLKGTMMGVAPPEMQAQLAAARAKASGTSPLTGPAPVGMPATDTEPPSEPDPLGGTMVGTSPFAPGGAFDSRDAIEQARGAYTPPVGAEDFNEDTPAAPAEQQEALRNSTLPEERLPGERLPDEGPMIARDPLVAADPMSALNAAAYNSRDSINSRDYADAPESTAQVPISKSSTGPIIFFAVLVVLVLAGVAFLAMNGGDDASTDEAPADAAGEEATPAEK